MHESRDHKGGGNEERSRVIKRDGGTQRQMPHRKEPDGESQCPQYGTFDVAEEIFGVRRLSLDEHHRRDKGQANQ